MKTPPLFLRDGRGGQMPKVVTLSEPRARQKALQVIALQGLRWLVALQGFQNPLETLYLLAQARVSIAACPQSCPQSSNATIATNAKCETYLTGRRRLASAALRLRPGCGGWPLYPGV